MSEDSNEKSQKPWPDYTVPSQGAAAPPARRKTNGQFNKGFTGNPKGRPCNRERSFIPRQLRRDILGVTESTTAIRTEKGKKTVSLIEAIIMRTVNKALAGHGPSIRMVMDWHRDAITMHSRMHGGRFQELERIERALVLGRTISDFESYTLNSLRKSTRKT